MTSGRSDAHDPRELATKVRRHIVRMTNSGKSSHVGTSLSATDVLAVLYSNVLDVDAAEPNRQDRDRFVLSKGHGCAALYAVLAECGFFPVEWLESFCQDGSVLVGHVTHTHVPGVEVSAGSLGHGLSIASGMALAAKRDRAPYRVFTLLSDGECDEGSTWEPALFASHHHLDNLIAIIDYNKIQSLGRVEDVMELEPFADKWRSFGWSVLELDGHDVTAIEQAFARIPLEVDKPSCVIAHTIKGKGVSFMEDKLLWHYRSPQGEEYDAAMEELGKDQ